MRVVPLLFAVGAAMAAQVDYLENAHVGMQCLQSTWYQTDKGVWSSMGWWNSANAMTTVANLAIVDPTYNQTANQVFYNSWVHGSHNKNMMRKRSAHGAASGRVRGRSQRLTQRDNTRIEWSQWVNDFYDDNGWWALAWIAAYDASKDVDYLTMAQDIFDNNLVKAGPSKCHNGGIVWSQKSQYVNAIANELYFSIAAHLAVRSASDKAPGYLKMAVNQLAWFNQSGMINAHGTINDGLDNNCNNNNGPVWTYNQGVIVGGLVELNKAQASSTNAYLTQAAAIAKAAIGAFADPTTDILHESCDQAGTCNQDQTQFKGVFVRNLMSLQLAAPDTAFSSFIEANANSIWSNARTDLNTFSENWSGPNTGLDNASTSSSALDCLIAAAAIQPK